MKIQQKIYTQQQGWKIIRSGDFDTALCNLILVFSSTEILSDGKVYAALKTDYPLAEIVLNSTAGEIMNTEVHEDSITVTAVHFEKTILKTAFTSIENRNSFEAGEQLAATLDPVDLKYVLVIADGQKVNGSELVLGLKKSLPPSTVLTGGLAGDGARFKKTLVGLNEIPQEGRIVVVGFYGKELLVTYGSAGGWDSFGPERLITKSTANVLYELDGKPALDIYKMYLGEYAVDLPSSGLMFPLSIRTNDKNSSLVRTILNVNEIDRSVTFAGNMPEGAYARLMKANVDRLIEGASVGANNSMNKITAPPQLALLISCVGRKLVLDQRIEEEVEVIKAIYGDTTAITGFYSYGEISPSADFLTCDLHNQTMTVTTFTEI